MIQAVFDEQLYLFADQWALDKFTANLARYVPALRGDCVVSFVESHQRVPGRPEFGLVHGSRLFFFASNDARERFRAHPELFVDADLANEGNCVVTQIDSHRRMPGMVESTAILDGMRYRFAGAQQRRRFLMNLNRYLAEPAEPEVPLPAPDNKFSDPPHLSVPQAKAALPPVEQSRPLPSLAVGGYCVVSLQERGVWIAGRSEIARTRDGRRYRFAGEAEAALFDEHPAHYLPALGGACPVTLLTENRPTAGQPDFAKLYQGRLFLFAGADQMHAFEQNPARYENVDLAAEGNCVVTSQELGLPTPGLPEFETWFQGRRFRFASAEKRARFESKPSQYVRR
jgi:YHS domain-containing protein